MLSVCRAGCVQSENSVARGVVPALTRGDRLKCGDGCTKKDLRERERERERETEIQRHRDGRSERTRKSCSFSKGLAPAAASAVEDGGQEGAQLGLKNQEGAAPWVAVPLLLGRGAKNSKKKLRGREHKGKKMGKKKTQKVGAVALAADGQTRKSLAGPMRLEVGCGDQWCAVLTVLTGQNAPKAVGATLQRLKASTGPGLAWTRRYRPRASDLVAQAWGILFPPMRLVCVCLLGPF